MKYVLFTLCLLVSPFVQAQPGTDIYLLDLSVSAGNIRLSNPKNISNKVGYDNQPFFHPTDPLLYYVSAMPDKQTDVWSYNLQTGARTQLTQTPDSEYSPTVLPGVRYLSCIVQRASNGDQDLVKYDLKKPANARIILESQKVGKVGYQAWLSDTELVTFILGDPQTLHFMNLAQRKDTLLATNIGRSLHRIPKQNVFSFVQIIDGKAMIRSYEPVYNTIADIAEGQAGSEHYNTWTPDGILLESKGNEILSYDPTSKQWQPVQLPDNLPKRKISRMAVQGNKMAIVLDE